MSVEPMSPDSLLRWYRDPDENANSSFEAIGEWFQSETGLLRPGKSYPVKCPSPDDLQQRWQEWCKEKQRSFRAGIARLIVGDENGIEYIAGLQIQAGTYRAALLDLGHDDIVAAIERKKEW